MVIITCLVQERDCLARLHQQLLLGENLFLHLRCRIDHLRLLPSRAEVQREPDFPLFVSSEEYFTTKEAGLIYFSERRWNWYCSTNNNGISSAQERHFIPSTASFPLSYASFFTRQMCSHCRSTNQCVSRVRGSFASLGLHSINNPLSCFSPVEQWPCEAKERFHRKVSLASLVSLW